jgi:prevent-host-death family protein
MTTVTALEAKTRFGKLLERVARGEEVVITKHDKPVARLVPEGKRDMDKVRKAAEGLRALQARIAKRKSRSKVTFADVKAAVNEGRP